MNPSPCAQPKIIVSCSNPGASQKATSAANRPSSNQDARRTHG